MPTLVACLSTGKGTWGHVNHLIDDGKFDRVFLITNDFGKENFNKKDKIGKTFLINPGPEGKIINI